MRHPQGGGAGGNGVQRVAPGGGRGDGQAARWASGEALATPEKMGRCPGCQVSLLWLALS